jgi:methylphosphotriester-DNA--protein-cysteine methyltransferase
LERFLIKRLESARVHDVVTTAMQEIARHNGSGAVADVAGRCGVSARHLNRLMREWVGYGPKRFARIMRFQTTLEQIEQQPTRSVAALASEAGYFDQAHLTLDLVRLAGTPPRRLASTSVADFSKTYCDETL